MSIQGYHNQSLANQLDILIASPEVLFWVDKGYGRPIMEKGHALFCTKGSQGGRYVHILDQQGKMVRRSITTVRYKNREFNEN